MTTTAQYATLPKNGTTQISTANANRDGTGTLGVVATASAKSGGGCRIDALAIQATGTTTAGMIRLFLQKGRVGAVLASVAFATTTATVTTVEDHGLTTGDTVTVMGMSPDQYNVNDAAVTVTAAKTFTYTMAVAPTTNATTLGSYVSSLATAVRALFREVAVSAITPSATVAAFATTLASGKAADSGYFPLVLAPGWSLRASTEKAEAFNLIPTLAGDFA